MLVIQLTTPAKHQRLTNYTHTHLALPHELKVVGIFAIVFGSHNTLVVDGCVLAHRVEGAMLCHTIYLLLAHVPP